jgi:hypothetical protein
MNHCMCLSHDGVVDFFAAKAERLGIRAYHECVVERERLRERELGRSPIALRINRARLRHQASADLDRASIGDARQAHSHVFVRPAQLVSAHQRVVVLVLVDTREVHFRKLLSDVADTRCAVKATRRICVELGVDQLLDRGDDALGQLCYFVGHSVLHVDRNAAPSAVRGWRLNTGRTAKTPIIIIADRPDRNAVIIRSEDTAPRARYDDPRRDVALSVERPNRSVDERVDLRRWVHHLTGSPRASSRGRTSVPSFASSN